MQRRLSLLLVLASLVLAGCFGSNDNAPPPPAGGAPEPDEPSGFPAAVKLTATGGGFEPSIEVDDLGTIYVTAAQGVVVGDARASRLWVSQDNGTTFTEIPPIAPTGSGTSNAPVGAEGDLAVGEDGAVYYVDLTHLAGVTVARSLDRGTTWELRSTNAFAVGGGDREWVAAGKKDVVAVTWNQVPTGMWVAVSTDGGRTFPTQTLVPQFANTPLPNDEFTNAGPIEIGPEGNIYVARNPSSGPVILVSTDQGKTFQQYPVSASGKKNGYIFPVLSTDRDGNVYVAWGEEVAGNVEILYAWSADQGKTWSIPMPVTSHAGSSAYPWIDARAPGHVAVGFYGAPGVLGIPDDTTADWYPYIVDVWGANTATPAMTQHRMTETPVTTGTLCTGGLGCGEGRDLGDYLQVAIGPDEKPHLSWTDVDRQVYWARLP